MLNRLRPLIAGALVFFSAIATFWFLQRLAVSAPVALDTAVTTSGPSNSNPHSSIVFVSDTNGYVFYVDSDGSCNYRKTTDGGASWGTEVNNFDSVNTTDCIKVTVWYDRWTPGDTTGNYIHVATLDTSLDDVYYTRLDTSNDTKSSSVVTLTQGALAGAGAESLTITKATDGVLYTALMDGTDSFFLRCTASCTTAQTWVEMASSGITNAENEFLVQLPLADADIMNIWYDASATSILWREYDDASGWLGAGWTTLSNTINIDATYDSSLAVTLDKTTNDLYLAVNDDTNAFTVNTHDLLTWVYNGSWTAKTNVFTNTPFGISGVKIAFDQNTNDIILVYTIRQIIADAYSAASYSVLSRDGMTTWESLGGPFYTYDDDLYGLQMNIMSDERIFATFVDTFLDDLYGVIVADLTTGTKMYIDTEGTQTTSFTSSATNQYIGAAFTFRRDSGTADIESISILETGAIDAETMVTNLDLYYEETETCSYDGGESLFGTDSAFSAGEVAVVTGDVTVGTTQMCFYPVFDLASGAEGSLDFEINIPNADVTVVGGGAVTEEVPIRLTGTSTVRPSTYSAEVVLDSTASDVAGEGLNTGVNTVFISDTIGYAFYVDADRSCNYKKTTDGGASWATEVNNFDSVNTADCIAIAVWYDRWTPGDTTGNYIHVATIDDGVDDIYYTRLDTSDDTKTASVITLTQLAAVATGAQNVGITKAGDGQLFVGLADGNDPFFLRCSSGCTVAQSWTEMVTSGIAVGDDYLILLPDGNDLVVIWQDVSADIIYSREWTASSTSWAGAGWTSIATTLDDNTTFDPTISATFRGSSYAIYLAVIGDESILGPVNGNGDIDTYSYDGSSWTTMTDVITDSSRPVVQVSLARDTANDTIYAMYSTMDPDDRLKQLIHYKTSTDGMSTWSAESTRTLNSTVDLTTVSFGANMLSDERIYLNWMDQDSDDFIGAVVHDITSGSLGVDIVDSGGTTVASPTMAMTTALLKLVYQTITGVFGTASEKIRVTNGTGASAWTLSIAATGGATAFWNGTVDYDYNDPTASAGDGGDADSLGGQMTIDASGATITPEGGCATTGITLGSSSAFNQGTTDSITLASADGSADTSCYWDITDIDISQTIPAEQGVGSYEIDMTLSIVAS